MNSSISHGLAVIGIAAAGAGLLPDRAAAGPARNGVLVELFTSQGCSSCPPADEVFGRIDKVAPTAVAVAWHVDYWNRLGWTDPFSDAEWTALQRDYARAWKRDRVYTPQAVVAGETHLVGSEEKKIAREVAAPRTASADLDIECEVDEDGRRVRVRVHVRARLGAEGRRVPVVVLVENDLVTRVPRGENAGRVLREDHVARVRRTLPEIRLEDCAEVAFEADTRLELEASWKRENLSAVVYLQDPGTLKADAAALRPVAAD